MRTVWFDQCIKLWLVFNLPRDDSYLHAVPDMSQRSVLEWYCLCNFDLNLYPTTELSVWPVLEWHSLCELDNNYLYSTTLLPLGSVLGRHSLCDFRNAGAYAGADSRPSRGLCFIWRHLEWFNLCFPDTSANPDANSAAF